MQATPLLNQHHHFKRLRELPACSQASTFLLNNFWQLTIEAENEFPKWLPWIREFHLQPRANCT